MRTLFLFFRVAYSDIRIKNRDCAIVNLPANFTSFVDIFVDGSMGFTLYPE